MRLSAAPKQAVPSPGPAHASTRPWLPASRAVRSPWLPWPSHQSGVFCYTARADRDALGQSHRLSHSQVSDPQARSLTPRSCGFKS